MQEGHEFEEIKLMPVWRNADFGPPRLAVLVIAPVPAEKLDLDAIQS